VKITYNLALYALAAFGAYKAYEASPIKIELGGQYAGRRGSIQEALLWEQAGHPSGARMLPRRY